MTPDETDLLYAYRAAMHPHFAGTAEEVDLWHRLLGDLPFEPARQALDDHYRSTKDPIAPTDIRWAVVGDLGVLAPDHGAAWEEAMRGCSISRRDDVPPVWSHPAIGDAVRAVGGVFAVCATENLPTMAAQFRDAYRAAAARVDRRALTAPYAETVAALEAAKSPALEAGDRPVRVVVDARLTSVQTAVKRLDDV